MYEILPPNRSWPAPVEALALALVDGVEDRDEEAALSLLFRDQRRVFARDDIGAHIDVLPLRVNSRGGAFTSDVWTGPASARIDWTRLSAAATPGGGLPLSPGERALILLACSIASVHCYVQLGAALGNLDAENRQAFVDAVAYAAGR